MISLTFRKSYLYPGLNFSSLNIIKIVQPYTTFVKVSIGCKSLCPTLKGTVRQNFRDLLWPIGPERKETPDGFEHFTASSNFMRPFSILDAKLLGDLLCLREEFTNLGRCSWQFLTIRINFSGEMLRNLEIFAHFSSFLDEVLHPMPAFSPRNSGKMCGPIISFRDQLRNL